MTEETPGIQNKKPLLAAAVLAIAVVVLYNIHVARIRDAAKGQTVNLLRYTRDIEASERIKEGDFEEIPVDRRLLASLGQVVEREGKTKILDFGKLNQAVQKHQLVFWYHVTGDSRLGPAGTIAPTKVAVALPLDANRVPGDIVRVGDRVNVLGMLSVKNGPVKTYRIIESVVVRTIGGKGENPYASIRRSRRLSSDGQRVYRTIGVEVTPDVSLKLNNLISWTMNGRVWIELCSGAATPPVTAGRINPELSQLAETANAGSQAVEQP